MQYEATELIIFHLSSQIHQHLSGFKSLQTQLVTSSSTCCFPENPSFFSPPSVPPCFPLPLYTLAHTHQIIREHVTGSEGPPPPLAAAAAAAQWQTVTECLTTAKSGGGRSPWVSWDSTSSVPLVQCLKVRRDPAQTRGTRTVDSLIQTSDSAVETRSHIVTSCRHFFFGNVKFLQRRFGVVLAIWRSSKENVIR